MPSFVSMYGRLALELAPTISRIWHTTPSETVYFFVPRLPDAARILIAEPCQPFVFDSISTPAVSGCESIRCMGEEGVVVSATREHVCNTILIHRTYTTERHVYTGRLWRVCPKCRKMCTTAPYTQHVLCVRSTHTHHVSHHMFNGIYRI